jgi:hypothetical protein
MKTLHRTYRGYPTPRTTLRSSHVTVLICGDLASRETRTPEKRACNPVSCPTLPNSRE